MADFRILQPHSKTKQDKNVQIIDNIYLTAPQIWTRVKTSAHRLR